MSARVSARGIGIQICIPRGEGPVSEGMRELAVGFVVPWHVDANRSDMQRSERKKRHVQQREQYVKEREERRENRGRRVWRRRSDGAKEGVGRRQAGKRTGREQTHRDEAAIMLLTNEFPCERKEDHIKGEQWNDPTESRKMHEDLTRTYFTPNEVASHNSSVRAAQWLHPLIPPPLMCVRSKMTAGCPFWEECTT